MVTKDSVLVEKFLFDFTKNLVKKFPDDVDFILVFGSAARGEFKAGVSDVDLIIQLKKKKNKKQFEKYAEALFWKFDAKYKTLLKQVCSTGRSDIFVIFEKQLKLYKPFEVLGPNDIDWKAGKITSKELATFAAVAPLARFAKRVKREGKILYGRNILEEINPPPSFVDDVKSVLIPYALSLISAPLSIIMPDKALSYSLKAVLYAISEQVELIENEPPKHLYLKIRLLRSQLGEYFSLRLAREAIDAKKNFETTKKEWSYIDKVAFCFQAPIYISYNMLMAATGKVIN
ncbi:nucleotidyltransferase domain-containing protein [Candidatus Micrarchaeota archaeon]|nr:nucleotidyltransferase domain-containing protein [Candidatus Micrarchaeota archaeon]